MELLADNRVAVAMAIALDEIRQAYGDECFKFVSGELLSSPNPRWEEVVYRAARNWATEHPRIVLDLDA